MIRTTFSRRALLGVALATTIGAATVAAQPATPTTALSADDQALVTRATAYLQDLTSARARFTQTDARGGVSQGSLYLQRPGKARFAYDPPSGLLVVSDGSTVSVQDARLKTFTRYPLGMTPLSLFLARNIRLDRGVTVARVTHETGGFTIVARDGKKQTSGQIALSFSDAPLALVGWTVSDAQNRVTRVRLEGLEKAGGLDPALFVLKDPHPAPVGRPRM